ncbi:MAG: hypothetical protein ACYS15_13270 [Planctomycetota bacterium]
MRKHTSRPMPISAALIIVVPVLALTQGAGTLTCDAWCLVENPSFELASDVPEDEFAGWCNFGLVGMTSALTEHGNQSATATGPNTGGWDVSGYWQPFEAAPGDRFRVVAHAAHAASDPIKGQAKAILNVEWRDAGEGLIAYETFDLMGPSAPTDCVQRFEFETGPAPAGTATARFLAGFLQSPDQETGTAIFDLVDIHRTEPPGWGDLQWTDFGDTTLVFAGRAWRVKGPGFFGPGPNHFSDSGANAWVDGDGKLHLRITHVDGVWYAAEVAAEEPLGYGEYRFRVEADLDDLDPNVVFGLFIWEYQPCWRADNWWNANNELDIEFSRWTEADDPPAQFVFQPSTREGNRHRFWLTTDGPESPTTHTFDWRPDAVSCRSWRGHADEPDPGDLFTEWPYAGPDIPRPEAPRVHLNLWLFGGDAPGDGQEVEVVVSDFVFVPLCPADLDGDGAVGILDFLFLLAAWGEPAADLDGDCATGITDFLKLLAMWGPCS